jgi:hypothetical protein
VGPVPFTKPGSRDGGGMRIRTADILLAKQTLYQLSYTPFLFREVRTCEVKRLNRALRYSAYARNLISVVLGAGPRGPATLQISALRPCSKGSTYRSDGGGVSRFKVPFAIYSVERR